MIKALIFDYDGVIVDSFPTVHKVYQLMCNKLGKKCPTDLMEFRRVYGKSSRQFMRNLLFTPEEAMRADQIYIQEILKQETPFFPGITSILQQLSKKYTLFLISSSPQQDVTLKLKKKGLDTLFAEIIGSQKTGPIKKAPEIQSLLHRKCIEKQEVIMIGDRINDYEDARKAGISKIILVEYGWGYNKNEIPEHKQKVKVKKPEDLLRAIKSLH